MTQRRILFEATGPTGQKEVYAKIAHLEATFLKARKRKLPLEILSVGHGGTKEKPLYSLTAYYETAQTEDIRFLIDNIT
jgi:hypothetical protein